ncbi:hypothetical protein GGR56DRAFT_80431 [Xylariaceae sp. FL0804]|nr:hypothetical protein GGR56DRAFT_80431 [Xylariaceae sp. FL0804]
MGTKYLLPACGVAQVASSAWGSRGVRDMARSTCYQFRTCNSCRHPGLWFRAICLPWLYGFTSRQYWWQTFDRYFEYRIRKMISDKVIHTLRAYTRVQERFLADFSSKNYPKMTSLRVFLPQPMLESFRPHRWKHLRQLRICESFRLSRLFSAVQIAIVCCITALRDAKSGSTYASSECGRSRRIAW